MSVNVLTLNAALARNVAFWRRARGEALEGGGYVANTHIRAETLAAYERGEKPIPAAHLLQLAAAWEVPVELFGADFGEAFHQKAARGKVWAELWRALRDLEDEGKLKQAQEAIELIKLNIYSI
jgi:transcriptional regulator with XRE-family HTH domain